MKPSNIYWMGALAGGIATNVFYNMEMVGVALQCTLFTLGCYLYGAAHKTKE